MKRDFILKITVLPIALGIVFSIVTVSVFCFKADMFAPVYEGVVLSKYEAAADTSKVVEKPFDEIEAGDCIGTLKGEKDYPIVADAPYHQLDDVVSYDIGSAEFGKAGYVYLNTDINVLRELEKAIVFRAEGDFEKHDYVLTDTKDFKTLEAVKAYAPKLNKCIIVYAPEVGKIGLTGNYKALIFEEVQL
ncbi:MAG: hypothetical protein IKF64_02880 [Eubacterium sp.]|nr:hypothetical protein [Eubacterium sp.]